MQKPQWLRRDARKAQGEQNGVGERDGARWTQGRFLRCVEGALWYVTEDGFEFPVPLEETVGASFLSEDKAMFFMRWINRHARMIQTEREAQNIALA